jgi:hypothetical protein
MPELSDDRSLQNFRAEIERAIQQTKAQDARDEENERRRLNKYADRAHRARDPATAVDYVVREALARDRYVEHHTASADLIRRTSERGMSRIGMERIWGRRLVNAVLDTK